MYSQRIATMMFLTATAVTGPTAAQPPTFIQKAFPSPRAELDKAAGYVPDETLREVQEVSQDADLRRRAAEIRKGHLELRRNELEAAKALRVVSQEKLDEVKASLLPMKLEEAKLEQELGADHPRLKSIRHRIKITELWHQQLAREKKQAASKNSEDEFVDRLKEADPTGEAAKLPSQFVPPGMAEAILLMEIRKGDAKLQAHERRLELQQENLAVLAAAKDHDDREERANHHGSELEKAFLQLRKREERLREESEELDEALRSVEGEEAKALRRKREELQDEMAEIRLDLVRIRKEVRDRDRHEEEHAEREGHERENHARPREFEGRMEQAHAMHEAAERLEASGLGEMAYELHRRAEELERELHRARKGRGGPEELLEHLFDEVQELRQEVRGVHKKLDRILEALKNDHDEEEEEFGRRDRRSSAR